jgi:glutathione synthase/RimK-type ligase-like ATP-grasp enzyme
MIDYRNYNYGKPNRFVPIVLPIEIEQKLHALMEVLQLNTGSIDLIYTKNNEYVFLEVNPVGQYGGMVSEPGNYYLDKIIAKHLCGHES